MDISFATHIGGLDTAQGYGTAGYNIVTSLQKLGYGVPFNDPNAPIQLNFTQPYYYELRNHQYSIGYTPWESTVLNDGWDETMNLCDEVWTTSDLIAQWFKEAGIVQPLHVFEHGLDHAWRFAPREPSKVLKFLHVGEPAPRKCGQMVVDVFGELFGNNPNYSLTIKGNGYQTTRIYKGVGLFFTPDQYYNNVQVVTKTVDLEDLVDLYLEHDVLIYPSYGEGFGFIPLQAIGTGMPVIMNNSWAPYRRLVTGPNVTDRLVDSPWPDVHPGKMLEPSKASLRAAMLDMADNYSSYASQALQVAPTAHDEYDWVTVTERAFKHVLEKF